MQTLVKRVAWFIWILSSHKFCVWNGNSYKCIFNKVRRKNNCVHAFSALIHHCASLAKPDSTILKPKDGLHWRKLLVKLALCVKKLRRQSLSGETSDKQECSAKVSSCTRETVEIRGGLGQNFRPGNLTLIQAIPIPYTHNKFWNMDNPISLFVWPSHKKV